MNPTVAHYLYLGTLMWEIMRIAQYSMSLGVLWNVWSHNFSNMFITPLSMIEYVLAQMISAAAQSAGAVRPGRASSPRSPSTSTCSAWAWAISACCF